MASDSLENRNNADQSSSSGGAQGNGHAPSQTGADPAFLPQELPIGPTSQLVQNAINLVRSNNGIMGHRPPMDPSTRRERANLINSLTANLTVAQDRQDFGRWLFMNGWVPESQQYLQSRS